MQSRIQSLIESIVNILLGYFVALATQLIVFPLYGMTISFVANVQIGVIFTVVSLIRGYFIRRLFNKLHHTEIEK